LKDLEAADTDAQVDEAQDQVQKKRGGRKPPSVCAEDLLIKSEGRV
jgi:hypothetical protein